MSSDEAGKGGAGPALMKESPPALRRHDVSDLEDRVLFLERCNIALWTALSATLVVLGYRRRIVTSEVSAERFRIITRRKGVRHPELQAELSHDERGFLTLRTKNGKALHVTDQHNGPSVVLSPTGGVTWQQSSAAAPAPKQN